MDKDVERKGGVPSEQFEEIQRGEFLTVSEVAGRLRYSYAWVIWMLQNERIKGVKPLGGRWRIPTSEFEKILKEGIPPVPRKKAEKPPVTEIVVDEKVVRKVKEPEKKEEKPPSIFPIDFSGLFGGKK